MSTPYSDRLVRVIGLSTIVAAAVGGLALLALMGLMFIDVVLRQVGIAGYGGLIEVTYLAVILAAFFGLPLVCLKQGHIVVDIATQHLPTALTQKIDRSWLVVLLVFLSLEAWQVLDSSFSLHNSGERSEAMQWSPLLFGIPVVIGAAHSAIICVMGIWRRNFSKISLPYDTEVD
jgi:TRAP-type C4-dicarboxylate transport system permease small subunit